MIAAIRALYNSLHVRHPQILHRLEVPHRILEVMREPWGEPQVVEHELNFLKYSIQGSAAEAFAMLQPLKGLVCVIQTGGEQLTLRPFGRGLWVSTESHVANSCSFQGRQGTGSGPSGAALMSSLSTSSASQFSHSHGVNWTDF